MSHQKRSKSRPKTEEKTADSNKHTNVSKFLDAATELGFVPKKTSSSVISFDTGGANRKEVPSTNYCFHFEEDKKTNANNLFDIDIRLIEWENGTRINMEVGSKTYGVLHVLRPTVKLFVNTLVAYKKLCTHTKEGHRNPKLMKIINNHYSILVYAFMKSYKIILVPNSDEIAEKYKKGEIEINMDYFKAFADSTSKKKGKPVESFRIYLYIFPIKQKNSSLKNPRKHN